MLVWTEGITERPLNEVSREDSVSSRTTMKRLEVNICKLDCRRDFNNETEDKRL